MKCDTTCRKSKAVYIYSCFIAFLPILSIYASGIPGVTLGDLGLILLFVFTAIDRRKDNVISCNDNTKIIRVFFLLSFYYLFSFFCSAILQPNPPIVDMAIRIIRFLFYILVLITISRKYFDYDITSNWVIRISIFAAFYVVIQYIFYYKFSYILSGYIKIFPIYLKRYSVIDYAARYESHFFRATSIFLEPAHYTQYAVLGLCFSLVGYSQKKYRSLIIPIIISAGIILSTSIQGITITALLWLFWIPIIYSYNKNKKGILFIYLILIFLPIIMYFVLNSDIVQNALSRIFLSGGNQELSAYNARFGGIEAISRLKGIFTFIGMGFGQVPKNLWMNSAAYVWYGTGLIGIILTLYLLIKCFLVSKNLVSRLVCLIYFVLFFSSDIFNSYICVFYFSFMCFTSLRSSKPNYLEQQIVSSANKPCCHKQKVKRSQSYGNIF